MATNAKEDRKGPGLFGKIGRSFRDMRGEVAKVVWPSKKQVINNTIIVLVFMLLAALVIGLFDFGLEALLKLLFNG